uniref:Endoplasmic reticulum junction formation protein lunapark n=1 Tax=Sinocyclocheilus grahami TaxID=75366 RepID=A0A672NSW4_SINGR
MRQLFVSCTPPIYSYTFRYALICQQCFSHNGMALKEEFEYAAFRCAYCYFMNPARKTRPQAPRLPEFSFEHRLCSESPETQSSAATETPEDSDAPEGISCLKFIVSRNFPQVPEPSHFTYTYNTIQKFGVRKIFKIF